MIDYPLYVTAFGLTGMGTVALVNPNYVFHYFGIEAATPEIRNEIRAVYGGFGVALAALLLLGAAWPDHAVGIRLTVAVALLGMAAGRMLGFCVERCGRWPWVFGCVELALGGALLV